MADFDHPLHAATPTGGDSRIDMDFVGTLYQAAQQGRGVIIFMYLHEARSLTARKSTSGAARRSWCNMPTSVATSTWRARVVCAASSMPPVDKIFTRSAGNAPSPARYSAEVAQPHPDARTVRHRDVRGPGQRARRR